MRRRRHGAANLRPRSHWWASKADQLLIPAAENTRSSALEFSGVRFEFQDFSPGFACASLLSLDEAPIASARRLLFSISGLAKNVARSASGPLSEVALAQYVPITVTLPRDVWHADALDGSGNPAHPIAVVNAAESKISTVFQGAALSYAFTR